MPCESTSKYTSNSTAGYIATPSIAVTKSSERRNCMFLFASKNKLFTPV